MSYWYSNGNDLAEGTLYQGDCRPGDRAATDAEASAWQKQIAANNAPKVISRRQFFEQAADQSLITQDEARSAIVGTALPASLQNLVNQLPADKQFDAAMKLLGAETFNLSDPLVSTMAQGFGWTDAQTRDFWATAAAL